MLCSRFLPMPDHKPKEYEITKKFDRLFDWTLKSYVHYLDLALVNRKKVLWGAIASCVITVALFVYSPKGFFPEEDIGQLRVTVEASEDTSFKTMIALQDQAAKIVDSDPNVATLGSLSTILAA